MFYLKSEGEKPKTYILAKTLFTTIDCFRIISDISIAFVAFDCDRCFRIFSIITRGEQKTRTSLTRRLLTITTMMKNGIPYMFN